MCQLHQQRQSLTVVVPWVRDVILQAVNGALAPHCCLAAEAHKGKHSQTAILELIELGLLTAHAHGVEGEGAQHAGLRLTPLAARYVNKALNRGLASVSPLQYYQASFATSYNTTSP